jgi:glycosyltransferase involved in cell wall biosynthesis
VRNGERWIGVSLASIAQQTFRDFEVVLIDDGCTDSTVELARAITVPRLRVIVGPQRGLAAALALGVAESRGTYIARQDVDDVSLPTRLAEQVDFMAQHNDVVAYGSAAIEIDEDGGAIGTLRVPASDGAIRLKMTVLNPMIHSSVLMDRSAVLKAGNYRSPTSGAYPEDYDLWVRLARLGAFANSQEPLIKYRRSPSGVSATHGRDLSRAAGLIARENVRRLLPEGTYHDDDLELFTFFHSRTRRINLIEMLRLERMLVRLKCMSDAPWRGSGWGREVCLPPVGWMLRGADTLET